MTTFKKTCAIFLREIDVTGFFSQEGDFDASIDYLFLTPEAYDAARRLNVPSVRIHQSTVGFCAYDSERNALVAGKCRELEAASSIKRAEIFDAQQMLSEWNYMSNYFVCWLALSAKLFAESIAPSLKIYGESYVVTVSNPGEFYFESSLQALFLTHSLRRYGFNCQVAHLRPTVTPRWYHDKTYEFLPNIFNEVAINKWRSVRQPVLLAPAAVFDDADFKKIKFLVSTAAPNGSLLSYPTPYWQSLPVSEVFSERIPISKVLTDIPTKVIHEVKKYSSWLTSRTTQLLSDVYVSNNWVNDPLFQPQIDRLESRHIFQTLTYLGWRVLFRDVPARLMILSIQDGGVNGPLSSAAREMRVPVGYCPHRTVVNWNTDVPGTVITEWWQPRISRSACGEPNNMIYVDSSERDSIPARARSASKRWTILYNGLNVGLFNTAAYSYIRDLVGRITRITSFDGKCLSHRLKPGDQTPAHFYVDLLGLDVLETAGEAKIALTEVIDQSELVISFDEPSSALWTAMIRGCPVVLVTNRELSNESLYDGDVLRAFTEEVALKLLRNFITNPESLNDYRDSQQLRLEKFRKSRIVHFIN